MKVGDGREDPDTIVGPVITGTHRDRVERLHHGRG